NQSSNKLCNNNIKVNRLKEVRDFTNNRDIKLKSNEITNREYLECKLYKNKKELNNIQTNINFNTDKLNELLLNISTQESILKIINNEINIKNIDKAKLEEELKQLSLKVLNKKSKLLSNY